MRNSFKEVEEAKDKRISELEKELEREEYRIVHLTEALKECDAKLAKKA